MSLLEMTIYMLAGAAFVCGLGGILLKLPIAKGTRDSASHSD